MSSPSTSMDNNVRIAGILVVDQKNMTEKSFLEGLLHDARKLSRCTQAAVWIVSRDSETGTVILGYDDRYLSDRFICMARGPEVPETSYLRSAHITSEYPSLLGDSVPGLNCTVSIYLRKLPPYHAVYDTIRAYLNRPNDCLYMVSRTKKQVEGARRLVTTVTFVNREWADLFAGKVETEQGLTRMMDPCLVVIHPVGEGVLLGSHHSVITRIEKVVGKVPKRWETVELGSNRIAIRLGDGRIVQQLLQDWVRGDGSRRAGLVLEPTTFWGVYGNGALASQAWLGLSTGTATTGFSDTSNKYSNVIRTGDEDDDEDEDEGNGVGGGVRPIRRKVSFGAEHVRAFDLRDAIDPDGYLSRSTTPTPGRSVLKTSPTAALKDDPYFSDDEGDEEDNIHDEHPTVLKADASINVEGTMPGAWPEVKPAADESPNNSSGVAAQGTKDVAPVGGSRTAPQTPTKKADVARGTGWRDSLKGMFKSKTSNSKPYIHANKVDPSSSSPTSSPTRPRGRQAPPSPSPLRMQNLGLGTPLGGTTMHRGPTQNQRRQESLSRQPNHRTDRYRLVSPSPQPDHPADRYRQETPSPRPNHPAQRSQGYPYAPSAAPKGSRFGR